jgi:putative intracellular protease/amidase
MLYFLTTTINTSIKKRCLVIAMALILCVISVNALALNKLDNVSKNKVLIVVSSDEHGYWLPEVLEPYQLLQHAGYNIDIASPKGGAGTSRGVFQLSKQQVSWFNNSMLKAQLAQSQSLQNVESGQYIAIYFAGGAGPMFDLADNFDAQRVTQEIYEAGGFVSADCHGPVALLNVKLSNGQRLIAGKRVTGKANIEEGRWARSNYPFLLEDELRAANGSYSAAAKGQIHVVVDQRIITGQNPASAAPMAKALITQMNLLAAATK